MSERPVRFGTSGWRGVLGEDFTFARARALAAAVGRYVADGAAGRRVLVSHDTRFQADHVAQAAAEVLAGVGARPAIARGPTPTPVATHAVRRRGFAAGFLVTASHNPPEYLGVKVIAPCGGAVDAHVARELEKDCARQLAAGTPPRGTVPGRRLQPADALPARPGRAPRRRPTRACAISHLLRRDSRDRGRRPRSTVARRRREGRSHAGRTRPAVRGVRARSFTRKARRPRAPGGEPRRPRGRARHRRGRRPPRRRGPEGPPFGDAGRCAPRRSSRSDAPTDRRRRNLRGDGLPGGTGRRRRGARRAPVSDRVQAADGGTRLGPGGVWRAKRAADSRGPRSHTTRMGCWPEPSSPRSRAVIATDCVGASSSSRSATGRVRVDARRSPGNRGSSRRCGVSRPRPRAGSTGARFGRRWTPGGILLHLSDGFALLRSSGTEPLVRLYAEAPGPRKLAARLTAAAALLTRASR